ncbi:hypothetical protein AVEN_81880-1 [Araneus ventricosus]|uniref:Uncharacterized protein n=1 Tax=Araneus ventricosus TaxID=182803 RepID=A0A4Y2MQN7_ARAVE|nr:hypothetical protein AVEN_81880-1 [Araneus ventricosus]
MKTVIALLLICSATFYLSESSPQNFQGMSYMNPESFASSFEKPTKQFESMKDFGNKDNMPGMEQAEDGMEGAKEAMEQGRKLTEDKMKDPGDFAQQYGKFIPKDMPTMN